MFMCVELMLNVATTLTFVTFSRMLDDVGGQAAVVFVLVVAAAEVVVDLAIIVALLLVSQRHHADSAALLEELKVPRTCSTWSGSSLPCRWPGFLVLVVLGRKLGEPLAGWLATVACGGSFV